jgi:acetyltransferase (GNAT) family protein
MKIIVSKLTEIDRESWEELYQEYAKQHYLPLNIEILNNIWTWIFDKNNLFFALIAKRDSGEFIGLAHCREMPSHIQGTVVGFLDDLFIHPKYKNTDVILSMYEGLRRFGNDRNWPFSRWITADNNFRGRSSYDKITEKHWRLLKLRAA